jgi:hypothetical protein
MGKARRQIREARRQAEEGEAGPTAGTKRIDRGFSNADHTYVFIDGEYLRRRHCEAMQQFFGVDGELELSPVMRQADARRVYFYDAIDDNVPSFG